MFLAPISLFIVTFLSLISQIPTKEVNPHSHCAMCQYVERLILLLLLLILLLLLMPLVELLVHGSVTFPGKVKWNEGLRFLLPL